MTADQDKHIAAQHKKAIRNRFRYSLLAVLAVVIISGLSAFLIPIEPDNILYSRNSSHRFYYAENYSIEEQDSHFSSKVINKDGEEVATVKTYFMVGGADRQDLLNQFYPAYFQTEESNSIAPIYQFQNTLLSFNVMNERVANVFIYDQSNSEEVSSFMNLQPTIDTAKEGFLEFSPNQYRDILDHVVYKEAIPIIEPQSITGNSRVDKYIRQKAEDRGYKQRVQVDESQNSKLLGLPLAAEVNNSLSKLIEQAEVEGHVMSVLSGYRSVDQQREIFLSRYEGGLGQESVLGGDFDVEIDLVLETTAPPGMSKHHSSYTVDLAEQGVFFKDFYKSESFKWLSSNDYDNAKKFGFVPSYPEEAENQGPNPEAWEYTYVGSSILRK